VKSISKAKLVEEDGWAVVADRDSDYFAEQAISIRVIQRVGQGRSIVYGLSTEGQIIQKLIEPGVSFEDGPPPFKFPADVSGLLGRAPLDAEPASERLTNKLESLLDLETTRVNRLINMLASPSWSQTSLHNPRKATMGRSTRSVARDKERRAVALHLAGKTSLRSPKSWVYQPRDRIELRDDRDQAGDCCQRG
jgi:hypothetical protein